MNICRSIKNFFRLTEEAPVILPLRNDGSIITSINYETDPIRFMFEAYLNEYNAVRREVEIHIELHERNINYVLLLIGVILSLFGLEIISVKDFFNFLNDNPYLYLVITIVCLIFPVLYIMRSNYVNTLESYQRHVLAPKI